MIDGSIIQLFQKFGPLIGVILFFIWRDWKREEQLTKRVDTLETYQMDVLSSLVSNTTTAIVHNTMFFKILIASFKDSPCPAVSRIPEGMSGE